MEPGLWRIGELSRRSGVSEHLLRAWERRYALLRPARSEGGFRLYSAADEVRIDLMKRFLEDGLQPAQAARAVLDASSGPGDGAAGSQEELAAAAHRLGRALEGYDESGAELALDDLLARWSLETALREVVLPFLHDLGTRWEEGSVSVTQEHFASNVLRSRLAALSRGWGRAPGAPLVLACPPGERHDLPLLCFGLVAHRRGRSIRYLGGDTPIRELTETADRLSPELVVLAATTSDPFRRGRHALQDLARKHPIALAGRGSSARLAASIGARHLEGDPVTAAEHL